MEKSNESLAVSNSEQTLGCANSSANSSVTFHHAPVLTWTRSTQSHWGQLRHSVLWQYSVLALAHQKIERRATHGSTVRVLTGTMRVNRLLLTEIHRLLDKLSQNSKKRVRLAPIHQKCFLPNIVYKRHGTDDTQHMQPQMGKNFPIISAQSRVFGKNKAQGVYDSATTVPLETQ